MKNTFRILGADFLALAKQFLAMSIVVALLFIPALYAWFNIYANWDPYGSTGNITIAVASEDEGYVVDGERVYKSTALMEQLAAKDSIHFVLYDDVLDALRDCEAGKCYGAIILNRNFTRNMYDLATAVTYPETTVTFYENFKLNPVANKITESAASSVVTSVQTAYFQALFETIFRGMGEFTEKIDLEKIGAEILGTLQRLRNASVRASELLAQFSEMSQGLAEELHNYDATGAANQLYSAGNNMLAVAEDIHAAEGNYLAAMTFVSAVISDAYDGVIYVPDPIMEEWKSFETGLLQEIIDFTYTMMPPDDENAQVIRDLAQEAIDAIAELGPVFVDLSDFTAKLDNLTTILDRLLSAMGTLQYAGLSILDGAGNFSGMLSTVLTNAGSTLDTSTAMAHSAGDTVEALDDTLAYARSALARLTENLDALIAKAEVLNDAELIAMMDNLFHGDGSEFAEFLACPVIVETEQLYTVSSYGTAMAPFYSTLAIWVGCVVLAAVIKTEAHPRGLKGVTENQLFWSRFLLYLILNEIQTAIIIAGDIWLLHISCVDVPMLFIASAFTSFVFTAFIYSMVLAFGDIGKAIVVVIMVLQIAGSSGTYPIEILTEVFSRLYRFFPFPYSIDAMREAICGFYGNDFWKYIGELMVFGVIGLSIGLFVRKPFIRVNAFVEEEMHESGVL